MLKRSTVPSWWDVTSATKLPLKFDSFTAHKALGTLLLFLQFAAEYVVLARTHQVLHLHTDDCSSAENGKPVKEAIRESSKPEPSTSTPLKPGIHFTGGDLIGPVLELPEVTNPYKVLAGEYRDLYEYFGDSLAGRLPHCYVKDYYAIKKGWNPSDVWGCRQQEKWWGVTAAVPGLQRWGSEKGGS